MEIRGQFIGHYMSALAFAASTTGAALWARAACLEWAATARTAAPACPACGRASISCMRLRYTRPWWMASACNPGRTADCRSTGRHGWSHHGGSSPRHVDTCRAKPCCLLPAGRPEFYERGRLVVEELRKVQAAIGTGYLCENGMRPRSGGRSWGRLAAAHARCDAGMCGLMWCGWMRRASAGAQIRGTGMHAL